MLLASSTVCIPRSSFNLRLPIADHSVLRWYKGYYLNRLFKLKISDVYYVAFGVKNSYGKDIYLRTNMPGPYNRINIPQDQQIQRTIVLLNQNLVNIHAFDAETGQAINIDNQNYLTLTPNRTRPTSISKMYYVPKEGKRFSATIQNRQVRRKVMSHKETTQI